MLNFKTQRNKHLTVWGQVLVQTKKTIEREHNNVILSKQFTGSCNCGHVSAGDNFFYLKGHVPFQTFILNGHNY